MLFIGQVFSHVKSTKIKNRSLSFHYCYLQNEVDVEYTLFVTVKYYLSLIKIDDLCQVWDIKRPYPLTDAFRECAVRLLVKREVSVCRHCMLSVGVIELRGYTRRPHSAPWSRRHVVTLTSTTNRFSTDSSPLHRRRIYTFTPWDGP